MNKQTLRRRSMEAQKDLVLSLLQEGASQAEISRKLDIPHSTLSSYINEWRKPTSHNQGKAKTLKVSKPNFLTRIYRAIFGD